MKKLKEGVEIKSSGGIFELLDNTMKESFNITDAEYDFICETATEEELESLIGIMGPGEATFSSIRRALEIRDKYLEKYEKEKE
jgi:hypothetical protein